MKKKKIISTICCILPLLVGCGGGTGDSTPTGSNGKQLITFFGWGSTDEQNIFSTMIDEFEKVYPQYTVSYQSTSADNFMTSLAGYRNNPRNMPDVFYMPDTSFVQWVNSRNNIMLDLTPYIEQSDVFSLDNVYSQGIEAYQWDSTTKKLGQGGIYGLPKDLGPNVLVYNKNIAKAKGLTIIADKDGQYGYNPTTKTLNTKVPMTWAQFVSFCKDTKSGTLDKSDSIVGVTHYPLESAYLSNNGKFLTDGNKTVDIANDRFAESLQFVADLSNKFGVMTTAEGQATQIGLARFSSGLAASSFVGAWETPSLWKSTFDWDILYTPVPNQTGDLDNWQDTYREGCSSQSYLGSVGISVYKDSKVKEGAYKLVEFLTVHPTAQRINYQLGQAVPNLKDMATGEFQTAQLNDNIYNRPENREVYTHMMENSQRRPQAYTYNSEWFDEMYDSSSDSTKLYRVWYNGSSVYGSHVDVWDWSTNSRVNNSFLSDLENSCQSLLDSTKDKFSW